MIPLRDTEPSHSRPLMTGLLIGLNILVFLYEYSLDPFSLNWLFSQYGLVPARFQFLDLITSMFLHGGWMHLIGNMWFLWIYGDNIEDILGRNKFLLFYLLCGIAAGLVQTLVSGSSRIPTVGASGAIAGVMGGYLVKFPRSKILTLVPIFVFVTTMEIPAVFILLYWFVIQFFSGIGNLSQVNETGGVAFFAHIGGFLAGMILIYIMGSGPRYSKRQEYNW